MSRFATVLKEIDKVLDIPQPSRSRVILEIQADIEDLYEHYVAQGLGDEEAVKRTEAEFNLGAEAIAEIANVHVSPIRQFLDRFSTRKRSVLEKIALALATIPFVVVGYELALFGGMSDDSGIWRWPLLTGTIAAFALGISKWYRLFVVKDHHVCAVRKRLDAVLYIALAQLALGFVGMYVDLLMTWLRSAEDKAMTVFYLAHWLQRSSALLSVAMIAALISALVWIVNSGKAASIEQYEAELILDSEGESK